MEEQKSVGANSPKGSSGLPYTHDRGKNWFRFRSTIGIGAREGHISNFGKQFVEGLNGEAEGRVPTGQVSDA